MLACLWCSNEGEDEDEDENEDKRGCRYMAGYLVVVDCWVRSRAQWVLCRCCVGVV